MIVKINIDKERDLPSPGTVDQSIKELANWRRVRALKDLPCGALDNAIAHLQKLHELACVVYLAELNSLSPVLARADSTLER